MDDDLATFLAVVDTGSFTRAAARVHRTQPAVSAAIARLEESLDARLLRRGPRGSQVTEAGRALVPHARAVLTAIADGRRAVAEVTGLQTGTVRIGAGATVCSEILPPYLASFHKAHPGVLLRLQEGDNQRILDSLVDGTVDIALATRVSAATASWEQEPWLDDTVGLYAAPQSTSNEVIAFRRGAAIRMLLDAVWPDADIAMELGSVSAVRAHAEQGVGLALLSTRSVQASIAAGALKPVQRDGFPIERTFVLCHRGVDRLSPAAAALRQWLLP